MSRGLLNVNLNTHLDLLYFNNDKTQLQECLNIFFNEGVINYTLAKESNRTRIINEIINNNEDVVNNDLYEAFSNNLKKGVSRVLNSPNKEDKYFDLQNKLLKNVDTFAVYKAYHCTQMIKRQVADGDGVVRTKKEIEENANKVLKIFNRWQSAEYNTAVARTRTGKQFSIFNEPDNLNTYKNIRWIPSRSVKQRDVHKPFYNLVLPKDDPFWQSNQPGNLWNCKCDWEQTSDSVSNVVPKSNIQSKGLEGNPATTGEIFTNNSSYISKCTDVQKQQIEGWLKKYNSSQEVPKKNLPKKELPKENPTSITNTEELTSFFRELNKDTKWFRNGFKTFDTVEEKNIAGCTDLRGTIWLKPKVLKNCIEGINNIRNGIRTNYDQEESLCTLWHEITHNKHKGFDSAGNQNCSTRKFMELANEFVARNTLPEFFNALGGEMNYPRFIEYRYACGYNDWVVRYQKVIIKDNLDKNIVLDEVKNYLFEEPYIKQMNGLILGLVAAKEKKYIDAKGKPFTKEQKERCYLQAEKKVQKCII